MNRSGICILLLVPVFFMTATLHAADLSIEITEKPVTELDKYPSSQSNVILTSIRFSPDFKHHAFLRPASTGRYLFVSDGLVLNEISSATPGELHFNNRGDLVLIGFEKDSATLWRNGLLDRGRVLVRGTFRFSEDGVHSAYVGGEGTKRFVVLDGTPGDAFDSIDSASLAFSPDSGRIGYLANDDGKCIAVVNGTKSERYDDCVGGALAFSPDGKRFAFAAKKFDRWMVVADGKEGPRFDRVGTPVFGSGGALVYPARQGNDSFVVRNGRKVKGYNRILDGSLGFSPVGRRLAYLAVDQGKVLVVLDDKEGEPYDEILEGTPVFSTDGRHVAYAAKRMQVLYERYGPVEEWLVIVDSREQKPYERIAPGTLVFSPDGNHVAYAAQRGGHWYLVADGKEGKGYTWIKKQMIAFTQQGRHLAYVAVQGDRAFLVVDGEERARYNSILQAGDFGFDDGATLRFLAVKGEEGKQTLLLVTVTVLHP